MSAIQLPAYAVPNLAEPFLIDFGGELTPFGGGPSQRLNRLGLRIGARFILPPKLYGTKGRVIVSRLMQAKTTTLLLPWPQPGFDPGPEGAPKVKTSVSGGTSLEIKGLPAGKELFEGQFFSIVGDQRYLHVFPGDYTADGSGNVTVGVWPPMRATFLVNDVIEIATPTIEGRVQAGQELRWKIATDKMLDIDFTLAERK